MADQARVKGPILVSAGLIWHDEQILIARRRLDDRVEPGRWEFAGGKLEAGESPEQCLARELREELDLEAEVGSLFGVSSHVYLEANIHVVLLAYHCRVASLAFKCHQAAGARWVTPDKLNEFDFAAADVPLVKSLLTSQSAR